jgi:hypothetical protein
VAEYAVGRGQFRGTRLPEKASHFAIIAGETVQSAADEARRCTRYLVDGWSHLPDGEDERVLKTLRNMADGDLEMGLDASDAQSTLGLIAEISQARQTAYDNIPL